MDATIVRLDPGDEATFEALMRLDALSFREALRYPPMEQRRRLALPGCRVLAARDAPGVVAVALLELRGDALFLDVLAVDPAWRRRGLGGRLVAETVRLAREEGAARVSVHAERRDQSGYDLVGFYAAHGFEVVEDHGDWVALARLT